MNKIANLRIHIAPMGFEVDRIVIPAKEQKADRVWLLTPHTSTHIRQFRDVITGRLAADGIDVQGKVHNRTDPFDIIRATRDIIQEEKNNSIIVNLSSGSKIQAVGCMLACMMFNDNQNVSSYYVEPKKYNQGVDGPLTEGVESITYMPTYEIQTPDKMLISVLHIIKKNFRPNKKSLLKEIQKMDQAATYEKSELTIRHTYDVILTRTNNDTDIVIGLTRLRNKIIKPLLKWGFINEEQVGRNSYVTLTDKGEHAIKFLPAFKFICNNSRWKCDF